MNELIKQAVIRKLAGVANAVAFGALPAAAAYGVDPTRFDKEQIEKSIIGGAGLAGMGHELGYAARHLAKGKGKAWTAIPTTVGMISGTLAPLLKKELKKKAHVARSTMASMGRVRAPMMPKAPFVRPHGPLPQMPEYKDLIGQLKQQSLAKVKVGQPQIGNTGIV